MKTQGKENYWELGGALWEHIYIERGSFENPFTSSHCKAMVVVVVVRWA